MPGRATVKKDDVAALLSEERRPVSIRRIKPPESNTLMTSIGTRHVSVGMQVLVKAEKLDQIAYCIVSGWSSINVQ